MSDSNQKATVIGKSMNFQGEIKYEGDLRVEGQFQGTIKSSGGLWVSDGGSIKGNLQVSNIVVAGHMQGNIAKAAAVSIESTGSIHGDMECDQLEIKKGGRLTGNSIM